MITVTLKEKTIDLEFDVNVVEVLQEEFDIPFSQIFKRLEKERTSFTTLRSMMTAMANEAIQINNDNNGTHDPLYRTWQIGTLIDYDSVYDMSRQLVKYVADRMPEPDEKTPK